MAAFCSWSSCSFFPRRRLISFFSNGICSS
jgi:hypothetical protein